ncbi:MAG TPA: GNAT family N-acetyltransferase [Rhizomicrobium sp.]|jgi:ribosomal protein S18 acetylase RimI-like enzyme|nr:GNAT family N-acetyltransferase [Rhizomicrobium sp.]
MTGNHFDPIRLGARIQSYLRAHALQRADYERAGPFIAGFSLQDANPYLNYAVPEDFAHPSPADIDRLIAAFRRRKRKPRLEYIAQAAPEVEPALLAAGFETENRFPLLACSPALVAAITSRDVTIETAATETDIRDAVDIGAEAYGAPHSPEPLRRLIGQGGVLMLARTGNTAVAAGMATPAHGGVTEVAGIGVRPAWQRRGIAAALTSAITREAFARGAELAWLTPGHEAAEIAYRRAGFVRATEQLHISRPG